MASPVTQHFSATPPQVKVSAPLLAAQLPPKSPHENEATRKEHFYQFLAGTLQADVSRLTRELNEVKSMMSTALEASLTTEQVAKSALEVLHRVKQELQQAKDQLEIERARGCRLRVEVDLEHAKQERAKRKWYDDPSFEEDAVIYGKGPNFFKKSK